MVVELEESLVHIKTPTLVSAHNKNISVLFGRLCLPKFQVFTMY